MACSSSSCSSSSPSSSGFPPGCQQDHPLTAWVSLVPDPITLWLLSPSPPRQGGEGLVSLVIRDLALARSDFFSFRVWGDADHSPVLTGTEQRVPARPSVPQPGPRRYRTPHLLWIPEPPGPHAGTAGLLTTGLSLHSSEHWSSYGSLPFLQ